MLMQADAYHAHVYFHAQQAEAAAALHARAGRELAGLATVWPIHASRRLFHPLPMFEIEFAHAQREAVLAWVAAHHGAFSVLLHPETDQPLRDHRDHAVWWGEPLALDLAMLEALLRA